MVDINLLEKRWIIYKLKTKIPYAIVVVCFILIMLFFLILEEIQKSTPLETKKIVEKKEKKLKVKKQEIKNIKIIYKKLVLEPSFDFLKRMQTDTIVYKKAKPIVAKKEVEIVTQKEEVKKEKVVKKEYVKLKESIEFKEIPEVKIVPEKEEITSVKINRQKKHDDIEDVVQRFNNTNNPILSLFIARKYYEMKDYNKAYNYALITNKLDSNLEESWFIFSKALVKLKKERVAIDVLKKYIEHTDSQEANLLLEKIQKGELK